ncbi:MAG: M42 family metallopeptidase [Verrucomicrobiales bacterium]|nr:M42 family metallopeptidase [Verrucomicrobiales bacterium]
MKPAARDFLFDLLSTPSPTGFEWRGQRKWVHYLKPLADAVESDTYGSAWATLEGTDPKAPRIMLEAHADEIGYMVKHISKEGYLSVDRVGGSDVATARGRRVDILGEKGTVRGIIGNVAIHIRDREDEKVPKPHQLWVDIGASSDRDVEAAGIRVGHPMVYADGVEELGSDKLVGRALDNRIGGFILSQVLARLAAKSKRPKATLIVVNAVQEEIGGHGARMVAHRLMPDAAVVLDVTHATDTPDVDPRKHGKVNLGGGPAITHGGANHPMLVKRLIDVAADQHIPLQHESSSRFTGTDTDVIFNAQHGIASALVSLPLRYMHSVVEMAHLDDIERVIELLCAVVRSIKTKDQFKVKL